MSKRKKMDALRFLIFCCFYVFVFFFQHILITAAYNLTPSQSIADGQTLISQGGTFKLGFFSPGNSKNRYLGIWYATIPVQTVVWVANRDSPLLDTSGVLMIGVTGNIVILNQTKGVIWSSNVTKAVKNPIIEFLQTGNLVLRDKDSNNYLWQSFDYPGDTMLPNMKLGLNFKTGINKYLSAWRDSNNPSYGGFTYGMDPAEYLELGIRNGSRLFFRTGPWNGLRFSGTPFLQPPAGMTNIIVNNSEEAYYMYQVENQSTLARLVLTQTSTEGHLQRFSWDEMANNWINLVYIPRDRCDFAGLCGPYSTCDLRNVAVCQCLKGFKPKALQDWSGSNWSQGCVRETSLNCTEGDGFIKYAHVRLPDTKNASVNTSINLDECRVRCLKQCSCMAFSNLDIRGGGNGCIMWFTDLVDIGQLDVAGQDLYVRMAVSELGSQDNSRKKERVTVTVVIASVAGVIVLGMGIWCIWMKRGRKGGNEKDDLELPQYNLLTITNATNNFSERNKLGEGGFGPVYKGKLTGDQEIAVKKLSKDSGQGIDEFRNEVKLISKLQHRNLVRLVGCCIEGTEKMLVYEYLQNKSLDAFIFDETKCRQLDWQLRFQIILGIARGLLYLHHDSRLRIIHRDLKASNILLDSEMVPKISDFGMARIFGGDQIQAKTKRVVGTYGYMSPEYAFNGHFSVKSDVFSFGVLVLEIISGKRNRGYYQSEDELNLLGHAWRLRNEGKSMELVDESLRKSCLVQDVSRCIHIGLLCVQKRAEERPTMSSVVLMLSSETAVLPKPQLPGFFMERSFPISDNSSSSDKGFCVSNDATITLLHAR